MDCYYSCYGQTQTNSFSSSSSTITTTTTPNKEKKRSNNGGGGGRKAPLKLSTDPQSVAARERRHRISDRFKILKTLVPGGSKMDTASMLDEAIHYVKFLKTQIWLHQNMIMLNSMDLVEDHDESAVVGVPPLHCVDYLPGGDMLVSHEDDGQGLMDCYYGEGGGDCNEVETMNFGHGYFMNYDN